MKKENLSYLSLFLFFLVLLFLSPISGDDWGNYIEGSLGLRHMVGQAIGMYFSWEGRFVSRLLINFLTFYKVIWNFCNALVLLSIPYLAKKLMNEKKFYFWGILLVLLGMNPYTFSQVVVWVAGNITYLFVIPLILYYYYLLFNKKYLMKKYNVLCLFLNVVIPMFVEPTGLLLVVSNFLFFLIEWIKNKKMDTQLLGYTIFSTISMASMLLSPGSRIRSKGENTSFNELSLLGKIQYNLPNFIYYTYLTYPLLIMLNGLGNFYLIKDFKNKKIFLIFLFMGVLFPTLVSLFLFLNTFLNLNLLSYSNPFILIFYLVYTFFNLLLLLKEYKDTKNDKILFFYIAGLFTNGVMLLSPTWGYRTSFATYLFLSFTYLIVIEKRIKEQQKWLFLIKLVCFLFCGIYLIFYSSVARQYKENLKIIEENKNSEVIYLKRYPSFANCNINPEDSYHLKVFKEYYGIKEDTQIELIANHWKFYLFYKE